MAKKIHFQDNLYQIAREIDCLKEGLQIDLDADFFAIHFFESIQFFHGAIKQLSSILEANGQFIERNEQLRNVYSVQRKFLDFLQIVESSQGAMQSLYLTNKQKIDAIKDAQLLILRPISDTLKIDVGTADSSDLVSGEELSQLLQF